MCIRDRDEEVVQSGRKLRFEGNYFTLDGRPVFLYGSDTYANVYTSACENPWTWNLDHIAARDYGFNVYENLQYSNPNYVFNDKDWRRFEGMAQLCQRNGLAFMPCQLVGHNVAIDDALLEKQAAQVKDYAEHLNRYPGLLYYLNGDFRWEIDEFEGSNEGLVVAEIELASVDQPFEVPPWAGKEVSGDPRYLNTSLSVRPYRDW